jgi:putative PIN family toxin of toxin-antitoxin system
LAPLRALLDTNILISYLLTPTRDSAVTAIVRRGVMREFVWLFAEDLLAEIRQKAREKPYLAERITPQEMARLLDQVSGASETVPRIDQTIPAVTRDPKDDYLLAYAVVARADYLVTGDADLLVLRRVGHVTIVTAQQFLEILLQCE